MVHPRGDHEAFGAPGNEPRWARGDKSAVGTAYATDSRLWFTLWRGIVSEVYAPTVDSAQVRDCQLLVWDDAGRFQEEQRDLECAVEAIDGEALGYRVRSRDPDGRYVIHKEIVTHPHLPCLLQRLRIEGDDEALAGLHLAVLCAPQLMGGTDNAATVYTIGQEQVLTADKDGCWLALGTSRPFEHCSCGYVGASDGWSDLAADGRLDWSFDRASRGNVALIGELSLPGLREGLTVALAVGEGRQHALTAILQAMAEPFERVRARASWPSGNGPAAPACRWSASPATAAGSSATAATCCWPTRTRPTPAA